MRRRRTSSRSCKSMFDPIRGEFAVHQRPFKADFAFFGRFVRFRVESFSTGTTIPELSWGGGRVYNALEHAEIAQRLRELRKSRGMTLDDLAVASRRSVNTLHRIETGRTSPRLEDLAAIASALGVSVSVAVGNTLPSDCTERLLEEEGRSLPAGMDDHIVLVNVRSYREILSRDRVSDLRHTILRSESGALYAVDWMIPLDPDDHRLVTASLARRMEQEVRQKLDDLVSWWPFKRREKKR